MAALRVTDSHDVEEERLYIIVKGLVIEEEFGKKTKVLTVPLISFPIHFPD